MNRRYFLISSTLGGTALLRQRPPALRVTPLVPDDAARRPIEMGTTMGVEEAQHAALLFGGSVALSTLAISSAVKNFPWRTAKSSHLRVFWMR